MLEAIESSIAGARELVDIVVLVPFPDGEFHRTIVRGLKTALAANPELEIAVFGGGKTFLRWLSPPKSYRGRLVSGLGEAGESAHISVANVMTSWPFSWNHAKFIAVDRRTVIQGGHNCWSDVYLQTADPVHDVSMRADGPVAVSAHRFADKLAAGVDVEIVLSNFGALYGIAKPDQVVQVFVRKLTELTGDRDAAVDAMCSNLTISTLRVGSLGTWPNGEKFTNHVKLVAVDDTACYIGSDNLYPSWLQEWGMVVDDPTSAATLRAEYSEPARTWSYASMVDADAGTCDI